MLQIQILLVYSKMQFYLETWIKSKIRKELIILPGLKQVTVRTDKGGIKITNRPTDVAIGGDGYFEAATPKGARYTLDGSVLIVAKTSQ